VSSWWGEILCSWDQWGWRAAVPGWSLLEAGSFCKNSACPKIVKVAWWSWEGGKPADAQLVLPVIWNLCQRCNQARSPHEHGIHIYRFWWGCNGKLVHPALEEVLKLVGHTLRFYSFNLILYIGNTRSLLMLC